MGGREGSCVSTRVGDTVLLLALLPPHQQDFHCSSMSP